MTNVAHLHQCVMKSTHGEKKKTKKSMARPCTSRIWHQQHTVMSQLFTDCCFVSYSLRFFILFFFFILFYFKVFNIVTNMNVYLPNLSLDTQAKLAFYSAVFNLIIIIV